MVVYLALLALSHIVIALGDHDLWVGYRLDPPTGSTPIEALVPAMNDNGPFGDRTVRITGFEWTPHPSASDHSHGAHLPVILLHGSPASGARDFQNLGARLASEGRQVIAMDRAGWGGSERWVPSYSAKANAHYALALMNELGIERAHVVGWSLSGGSVLWMAELSPERIASVSLVAAIGAQEGEGSGDYYFEHFKYAVAYAGVYLLPEAIPHFGLLPQRHFRHAFARDFWDTDQRPLRAIMERMTTPVLVLHGRHDPLVSAWTAEHHHQLIEHSRLVMMDSSHFFPIGPPMSSEVEFKQGSESLGSFFAYHDDPGAPAIRSSAVYAPGEQSDAHIGAFDINRSTHWLIVVLIIALGTFISEDLTVIGVGLLVSRGQLDIGVGLVGCFTGIIIGDLALWAGGRFLGRRLLRWRFVRKRITEDGLARWERLFDKHTAKAVFLSRCLPGTRLPTYIAAGILARRTKMFLFWVAVAVFVWTPFLLILSMVIGKPVLSFFETVFHGWWAYAAAFAVMYVIIRVVSYETTAQGRQKLLADIGRLKRVEFWPSWAFYLPAMPWLALLALRHGALTFTCVNPGIPNGGGVVGESKHQILLGFGGPGNGVLPYRLIPAGGKPIERATRVLRMLEEEDDLGGFPVILKPDTSQRGHGLKLARTARDVEAYFQTMTRDTIVQRYSAAPIELGVLWARVPNASTKIDDCAGEVISVTRKVFPVIEGDGEQTLEELIWHHPRYRLQAKVFLTRFAGQTDRVLGAGERMPLGVAGNHAQGTMFTDGADLLTPELSEQIDALARSFTDPQMGGRLDFGRFDIRYESEDAVRAGRTMDVVELNGTMSESTHMYDPDHPAWWTYGVLLRHWTRLYRLGGVRRKAGQRPMGLRELISAVRSHYKGRPGTDIAD